MSSSRQISKEDFENVRLIGKGSFGKVYQVMKETGNDKDTIYAMKVLTKKEISKSKLTMRHNATENNVLMSIKHPFIVKLFYVFQDSAHIFYIMEYLWGGELLMILSDHKVLTEDAASFYIKELVEGLEYLHSHNIVYRDLKPENVMLDEYGHVKIIDFGLSRINTENDSVAYTICGSPTFIAPEVVLRKGHGTPADWWSLGVLFYLMVVGTRPFEVYHDTVSNFDYTNYSIPEHLSAEAKSLIKGLLEVDQKVRLGSYAPNRIKEHAFFRNTCWYTVFYRKEIPPFPIDLLRQPVVTSSQEPLSYLNIDASAMETTSQFDDSLFQDFNYVCPSLLEENAGGSATKKFRKE